ncbi:putative transcriptional regulator [Natrinema hispanicum]|uniref:Putative transcriptional regulator n=1 Tax=Natrinema hispanicum TaxID=392421 RepID=A0A482YBG0_9EURY|nr:transcriptional regulator [Natrinema hispanicum]RZV06188.1 putative transcriptional regulator [Natrinema hispanicum]
MTTLHITVGDRAQVRKDTLQFIQDAEADELDQSDEQAVLQFGTYDDLVDSLTPLRLTLIQAIAKEHPSSMREAARLVDRDVSDVHADLKHLEVLGILELEEGGPGGAIQPIVPFDKIEMHIDYPLLDDSDADSTPASAD